LLALLLPLWLTAALEVVVSHDGVDVHVAVVSEAVHDAAADVTGSLLCVVNVEDMGVDDVKLVVVASDEKNDAVCVEDVPAGVEASVVAFMSAMPGAAATKSAAIAKAPNARLKAVGSRGKGIN
jgi:hypothetical protein